jgi:hypothetical protein
MKVSKRVRLSVLVALTLLALGGTAGGQAQQSEMTFFITSAGSGKGGDLGGLSGADQICELRAQSAGAGGKNWRAYLSTQRRRRQCARPDRPRPLAERQGRRHREGSGRAARPEQHHEADGAEREGRHGERAR